MLELIAMTLLLLFVIWGATTDPGRPFSWAMYSGSSKAFFWIDVDGCPRVPSHDELRLAPDSHYLSLSDLRRVVNERGTPVPLRGLIIGSGGNWLVAYDGDQQRLSSASLTGGEELDLLVAALRRCECQER